MNKLILVVFMATLVTTSFAAENKTEEVSELIVSSYSSMLNFRNEDVANAAQADLHKLQSAGSLSPALEKTVNAIQARDSALSSAEALDLIRQAIQ